MSTNISKKKRDDLLDKIKQIRAFIAAAPQDENTGNLLSYLSELEKDVNGKNYGLVFEEHREEIDEVLDTHTPVLTEDAEGGEEHLHHHDDREDQAVLNIRVTLRVHAQRGERRDQRQRAGRAKSQKPLAYPDAE